MEPSRDPSSFPRTYLARSGRGSRGKPGCTSSNARIDLMPRWIGLLGSWALSVLALGLTTFAAAGEWINIREDQRFRRLATIDQMIAERTGRKADQLRATAERRA